MKWPEIRNNYPEQWLIIEAMKAHTENRQRLLDHIAVIETCIDGAAAMKRYQELHRQYPQREFYFVHTQQEKLDITERRWAGLRSAYGFSHSNRRNHQSTSQPNCF